MMSEVAFYDMLRQGLWTATVLSLPILSVALVAGLAIGLLQALTSVQEQTLTFVPKLAAIVAVFWVSMGFMTETLVSFFRDTIAPAIVGG
ncbi:flagellar biosynthetic protein FliQ [Rubellimicrobium aerolatum]|uniref:Flagellar biosynthetic protein FliQ n=1 Tax=Rubellimicrobium aerolatum TaxID=490979 RepID=A0ABW0S9T3_9RHOB|nr:flagellar biosynthetic protein FliQ [Rubellimicrobium aerolatum]MBP1805068.1 flagellar biosynthetic protein FliQ [Rubellimicrobium aerolatum]